MDCDDGLLRCNRHTNTNTENRIVLRWIIITFRITAHSIWFCHFHVSFISILTFGVFYLKICPEIGSACVDSIIFLIYIHISIECMPTSAIYAMDMYDEMVENWNEFARAYLIIGILNAHKTPNDWDLRDSTELVLWCALCVQA